MKCLECAINPLLHSLSGKASNPGLVFGLCQMACVFKAGINPQLHRPGNFKGVLGFKIVTELLAIIDESGRLLFCACGDYIWS